MNVNIDMIRDIRMILTRLFTVALLMMVSMAAGAQVKVIYGKDGEAMKADEKGTIVIPQKEQKELLEGGTITITQEKPTDGKVRVNFNVAPASGYTYTDGNITLVAFYPLSSTRADSPAEDITVHSTLTLHPKDESQTDTSKPRDYYVDIDEGLGLWVQSATFEPKKREGAKGMETYWFYVINNNGKQSVCASATVESTSTVLYAFKHTTTSVVSPFIADNNYYFYDTEDGAIAATELTSGGGNGSSIVATIAGDDKKIYVRYYYDNSSSPINLNGDVEYNIMVGGRYFADNITRDRPETIASGTVTPEMLRSFETTQFFYLWKLTGNDPYNIALTSCHTPGDRFLWGQWGTNGSAQKMYINNGVDVNLVGKGNLPLGTTIVSSNLHLDNNKYNLASFILLPHSSGTGYVLMAATTSNQPKNNQYAYQTCSTSSVSGYNNPYVRFSDAASAEVVSLTEAFPCKKPTFSYNYSNYEVTIESETEGVTIYYTLTGADPVVPGAGNAPVYPTQLYDPSSKPTVNSRTVLKAVAVKSGKENSDVASTTIVTNPVITLAEGPFTYSGSAIEPSVSSVKDGETVIDPSEYTVSYSDNVNVGSSATVNITANEGGSYIVNGSATFTIDKKSIGSGGEPASGIYISVSKSGENYVVTVTHGSTILTYGTDYTWTEDNGIFTVTGIGNNYTGSATAQYYLITPGYYALHQNGKGYLRRNKDDVTLSNDGTFRYENSFDDNGSSIWCLTPEGYLQSDYYYLNVSNKRTLYFSVTPVTHWVTEDIPGDEHNKKHLKINDGVQDLYLCNDNDVITLKASSSACYNACPITLTEAAENGLTGPTTADITVQSPQQITYLRNCYFTQKMSYEFYNDAGEKISESDKDRRVFVTMSYKTSSDTNKGTKWDLDETNGIIYSMQTSDNVDATATYNLLPADPFVRANHSTAVETSIKFTLQPKAFTPDTSKDYVLFSINGGDDYRYPFDDGISSGGAVKPDGKGGTSDESVLRDPDSNKNPQISWKITVDNEGFCTFQNSSSNKYLYYDETQVASSDYGALCVGSTPSDNRYKFLLYETSDTNYGTCYYIIPYSKLFVLYKNDGLSNGIYSALNIKDYESNDPKVISLFTPNANSTWCIYKYEAEYRIKKDFTLKVENANTASVIGDYKFSSSGWCGKYIKESPNDGQIGLVISGTYKDENNINYQWTITGLGDYITIDGGSKNETGTWTKTTTGGTDLRKLTITVLSLPTSAVSGVIKLKISGGVDPNVVTSEDEDEKTIAFTILGNGVISWQDISSLSSINNSNGAYRLTADVSDTPGVTTFSGILDGDGHTISGLSAPLFTTLTNGTVRNVNLSGVSITGNSGPTGAIAGTANGGSRIYNVGILSGSVGGTGYTGGLVGLLDGSARVINCFSYADITSGSEVGGIVGYNNFSSKASDIRTMVMNCMFYGDITGGSKYSPVYGGLNIDNLNSGGLNTFNYYAYEEAVTFKSRAENANKKYNSALAVEEKYLKRIEFYRLLLNSNKKLAAYYASTTPDEMAKWVLETADRQIENPKPYPVLKARGRYPSIINPDFDNAPDCSSVGRNHGGKLSKTLTVHIGGVGSDAPSGASIIRRGAIHLERTDKDFDRYNFNYDKVQLPYYNDVGTGNYTNNKVVTGWKIVSINGGTKGTYETGDKWNGYNFADRNCTNKDLYGANGSNRVFSQGAYFDVPYGVTSITIEPYWGNAAYVADEYLDVVCKMEQTRRTDANRDKNDYVAENVEQLGKQFPSGKITINGSEQTVYTSISDALGTLSGSTVYDNAVVLVGNLHQIGVPSDGDKEFTMMSVDLDEDNEPDCSLIYCDNNRSKVSPIRFDFLNIPGMAQAQKPNGTKVLLNAAIFKTKGWFEVTNTALIFFTQFEYENLESNTKKDAPLIFLGGYIDQFVSTQSSGVTGKTIYIHVGDNVLINSFGLGTHSDGKQATPHVPVSVTGGDFNGFYLTGTYNQNAAIKDDNAECYISGGRFGELAGAAQEQIGNTNSTSNGNVRWQIYDADITEFYGGGVNDAKPVQGSITTDIFNSHVGLFCGGPKFGNMASGKTVTTTAEGCTFTKFFGAGYGGNSYSRKKYSDATTYNWNTLQGYFTTDKGKYFNGTTTELKQGNSSYGYKGPGVASDFDYEYFVWTSGDVGVRFFVKFVSFSLAQCNNVTSTLTGCTVDENFYGGGSRGKVIGTVTSILDGCTVKGNVFGAGYSGTPEPVPVRSGGFTTVPNFNGNSGMFESGVFSSTTDYDWMQKGSYPDNGSVGFLNDNKEYDINGDNVVTTVDITSANLGSVNGSVSLTIKGDSKIGTVGDNTKGNVYGGGDESYVIGSDHKITVNLQGNTQVLGNVYGGGNKGLVEGSTEVNIKP